ncbi:MAG: glycosyltransferase family 2 protein [Gammaproteobacteria bacterium]
MTIQPSSATAAASSIPAPSLSIVVPAYNEAASVGDTVAGIRATMGIHGVPYTLILVDDGSTDETPMRLAALAAEYFATTCVVTHSRNLGLGRAIASGYAAATTDWVGWLPADGQFSAEDLYTLYAACAGKDAVIGHVRTTARGRADNLSRVVISCVSRVIMRLLHPRMPRFNGVMVVRRDLIAAERLVCHTGFINMEILDRIRRGPTDRSIGEREVSVVPRKNGYSKVANLRTTFAVLYDLWALRLDYLIRGPNEASGSLVEPKEQQDE